MMGHIRFQWRPSAVALAASLCLASTALAQSSEGSLFGRTKSGASVSITSVDTGLTRQIKAEADGSFNIGKLPPGRYRITSGNVTREVNVAIGSGTEVVLEELQRVEVTGSRSVIDVSSAESNSVFTQEQIRALPVQRSVDAVALLAPGTVKGDNFAGAGLELTLPSFGGASIAENGYYINGLDVTNIRNFLSYADLPFDAIAQQQVKTGGYGAEYGRSLGGVVSLVTKKGTNEWKGGAAFYWEPRGLREKGRDVMDKEPDRAGLPYVFNSADRQDNKTVTVYGGGPIIKDRLFVFGLLEGVHNTRDYFDQSGSYRRTNKQPNGLIKLDWQLTPDHLIEYTGISNKKKRTVTDYTNAADGSQDYSTQHNTFGGVSSESGGGYVNILKYTGYLTDNLTVSALAGTVTDKRIKTTGYRTQAENCPVVLDVNLAEIGCWIGPFPGLGSPDPAAPPDEDKRKSFRLDVEYTLGKHTIKAGIDNQVFDSGEAGGSSYSGGHYYRYFTVPANGQINGVGGFTPGTQYVRDRVIQSTTGVYRVKNSAYYLEDTWKVNKNLMLYGGLRWESFDNQNGDGESFVKAKNLLAPRTGFAWDVKGDSSTKVFGNAGRYYIPVASNTNIRATRGELFTHDFYTFASRDPVTKGPVGLSGKIGVTQVNSDGSLPDPGTVADTKLKPMNQDEFILGIQRALTKNLVVGAKATHRKINAGMDDYCDHKTLSKYIAEKVQPGFVDNLATCQLINPGQDVNLMVDLKNDGNLVPVTFPAAVLGLANYERTYKALELSLERPWDGRWGLAGSWTISASRGTAEGYVQSNLDQSDAGITQDFDFGSFSHGAKGPLPNDRRHVFKLFGNYQATTEVRIGFNATVASGRPLSCIGFVPPTVSDFSGASSYTSPSAYYCIRDANTGPELVPRGSVGRTPWTRTFDLQIAYVPTWANKKLTLQLDIFNLFNAGKPTELNEVRDYSRQDSSATSGPWRQNLNYLSPTSFQAPRYVRLGARYEF